MPRTSKVFSGHTRVGCEVPMAELREYDLLVNRLRAELAKAEQEFRVAATPESQDRTRDQYEHALEQYSDLILRHSRSRVVWQ